MPSCSSAAIADRVVRRPDAGVRVRIFGPLEARLQRSTASCSAGSNEGTWPPETRSDPWLSRPMRRELGLDLPERRIGLSAHDFAQALGAPRSDSDRAPPSSAARRRWPRVSCSGSPRSRARRAGRRRSSAAHEYLALARARSTSRCRASRRAPRPGRSRRSRRGRARLWVTEIEHWLRDPYTIYAKHILRLAPLDAVDTPPGAADRGTVDPRRHRRFHRDVRRRAARRSGCANCIELGEQAFRSRWTITRKPARSGGRAISASRAGSRLGTANGAPDVATLHAEIRGELEIPLGKREFTLSALADRIEQRGGAATRSSTTRPAPRRTEKQVRTGLSPQLTLEAAILRQGGFKDIAAGCVDREFAYVALNGGEPRGRVKADRVQGRHARRSKPTRALAKLTELARSFENGDDALSLAACTRCGPSTTATTTISRASRNGRSGGDDDEDALRMSAPRDIPAAVIDAADRARPIPASRPGSPPMPAPARRMCWRSASSACCCAAPTRRRSSASPSPRRPPPTWRTACSSKLRAMDHAGRRRARRSDRASTGEKPRDARAARSAPAAVRLGAGNAGRPEGADHPRLLHPAAASVSVRGQRGGALRGARRGRRERSCSTG